MKRYSLILSIVALFTLLYGCEKEMIDFEGRDGVYFQMQPKTLTEFGDVEYWPYSDTTQVPFGQTISDDSTIMLKVKLVGYESDVDRKFIIVPDASNSAVAGVDYDAIDTIFYIKAHTVYTLIPITFHRTLALSDTSLSLRFNLKPTDDLIVGLEKWHSLGQQAVNDTARVDIHTFVISDVYFKPNSWNDYQGGSFTIAKFKLLMDLYGLTPEDFDKTKMSNGRFKSLMISLKHYLAIKEEEGNPVYETDRKGNIIYVEDSTGNQVPLKMTVGAGV